MLFYVAMGPERYKVLERVISLMAPFGLVVDLAIL